MKSKLLLLILFVPVVIIAQQQDSVRLSEPDNIDEEVFMVVEEMPKFPGGELEMRRYIAKNIVYPSTAKDEVHELPSKIYIRFMVSKTGDVDSISVLRSMHPVLDEAFVDIIKKMPKWKPGRRKGKPVNVWYTVPIYIHLRE